jgi:hypothetical protein
VLTCATATSLRTNWPTLPTRLLAGGMLTACCGCAQLTQAQIMQLATRQPSMLCYRSSTLREHCAALQASGLPRAFIAAASINAPAALTLSPANINAKIRLIAELFQVPSLSAPQNASSCPHCHGCPQQLTDFRRSMPRSRGCSDARIQQHTGCSPGNRAFTPLSALAYIHCVTPSPMLIAALWNARAPLEGSVPVRQPALWAHSVSSVHAPCSPRHSCAMPHLTPGGPCGRGCRWSRRAR